MRSWRNSTGREWELSITVRTVKAVKEANGVLLTGLFDDDSELLAKLSKDVCLLVDVLWTICKSQAGDVTPDQFAEALSGDSLGNAGMALMRAVADFFTSPAQRAAIHSLLDKMEAAAAEMATGLTSQIDKLDPSQMAKDSMAFALSSRGLRELNPGDSALAN